MLNQIHGVPESTLLPIYLGSLRQPVKNQVRFQHPPSVAAAMAPALEFDSAGDLANITSRRPWQGHDSRAASSAVPIAAPADSSQPPPPSSTSSRPCDYSKLPVVRLTVAEKAEKSHLGLSLYCSEKWVSGHVCKGKFLAYMGSDDEEDDLPHHELSTTALDIITEDLSHVYSMDGRPHTAALKFQGFLGFAEVFILVDTGSTHNFVHPRIAEKIKLPLTAI